LHRLTGSRCTLSRNHAQLNLGRHALGRGGRRRSDCPWV